MAPEPASLRVEAAAAADLPAVVAILNHYVRTDHCTFDTEPWSVEDKRGWFDSMDPAGPHRLLVARRRDTLLGYAHSGAYRPKKGYATTVETTVYVHPEAISRGVGKALLSALIAGVANCDVRRAIAIIAQPNDASNRLHEKLGYRAVGTLTDAGRKFGSYWDTRIYEYAFDRAMGSVAEA